MTVFYARPATPADISRLEAQFNIVFPEAYRAFLLEYNGMFVDDGDYVDFKLPPIREPVSFQAVYGIGSPNLNFDLETVNHSLQNGLEVLSSPWIFGEDPGGNFYLFDAQGTVYYWDRTHLHAEPAAHYDTDTEGGLFAAADSFADFYRLLHSHISKMRFCQLIEWPNRRR